MDSKNFKMENLKNIREKKNITQIKLSVDIEVSQELISQYELGKTKPTVENLLKLADYFNCSTDYLLQRTNTPTKINTLDKKELEVANIVEQYKSLSTENQKHLQSYLNHLSNQ